MKIIIVLFFLINLITSTNAQSNNDVNRIVLNSVVLDKENKMPEEAKNQLLSKLTQIASISGMGGNSITPRFVIAAKINILSKDIVAGPPQMIALNSEIVFFIGDIETNQVFTTSTIPGKGLGTNETKALIYLIQSVNLKNNQLVELTEIGKNKIVEYYNSHCDFIIQNAQAKERQQQFDEAIYSLMQVPEVCKSCYVKCLSLVYPIYKGKIDRDGSMKLNEAKSKWNANPNRIGADNVSPLLSSIEPGAACYKEALALSETIRAKIEAIEKRNWEFKMKIYNDAVNLESQRIESERKAAIAYYQNLPKTIIYNRIIW